MKRLSLATLDELATGTLRPRYDIRRVPIGIVHFGPGAFFRAHQATYVDRLLAGDPRWGICAVSLHSAKVRDQLMPQDNLYSLAELDVERRYHIVGSVREILAASSTPDTVMARLAAPDVRLVTLTVTETGYCLDAAGRLDENDSAVRHDLASPAEAPHSVIGWLAAGLQARRSAGLPPFVIVSCDNLSDNGGKLGNAVIAFAHASGDVGLANWIESHVRFPRTMVDSITPATDDRLRQQMAIAIGLEDAWPIQRESFCQWVIDRSIGEGVPDLAAVGATLTSNVALFERAKLRLLNGAHSSLAYIGRLAGLETVAAAMATPVLAGYIERLMQDDIAPTLTSGDGLDLAAYGASVRRRFVNPALRHELAQIAWDGSKKLPIRLLGTIEDSLAAGRSVTRLAIPVAAWMLFVRKQIADGQALIDPLAGLLTACVGGAVDQDVARFLDRAEMFPQALRQSTTFRAAVQTAHAGLQQNPMRVLAESQQ